MSDEAESMKSELLVIVPPFPERRRPADQSTVPLLMKAWASKLWSAAVATANVEPAGTVVVLALLKSPLVHVNTPPSDDVPARLALPPSTRFAEVKRPVAVNVP